jgi:superoxide dismutase, Fe-Mn family
MAYQLPDLRYDYSALEPHIDARTMEIHYTKHHQTYITTVNKALEAHPDLASLSVADLLKSMDKVPADIKNVVNNHGGGHFNHCLFWSIMGPNGGGEATGNLAQAINSTFGDFKTFQEKFNTAAATRFGSGWAWLSLDKDNKLVVESSANQDCPLVLGHTPIMGIDVWEHAYYLHYQNRRADYLQAWWNVIDWSQVSKNFESATAKPGVLATV